MTRPRIALTAPFPASTSATYARYIRALERAGADVIEVHPHAPLPQSIDGLCLSGGGDISPEEYGEGNPGEVCTHIDVDRDKVELAIARSALARDLPVLGICRGFQMLNVVFDGKLLQDVRGHRAEDHTTHRVRPAAGSRLERACGQTEIAVNSRHHQAVTLDQLGESLEATAFVGELVEAFESKRHRWVVGVQWHPERVGPAEEGVDNNAARIFDAFVAEASRSPSVARTP